MSDAINITIGLWCFLGTLFYVYIYATSKVKLEYTYKDIIFLLLCGPAITIFAIFYAVFSRVVKIVKKALDLSDASIEHDMW